MESRLDESVNDESNDNIEQDSEHSRPSDESDRDSRRAWLKQIGRKALYVMPAVLVLAAAPLNAWASAPASGVCTVSGGACASNDQCCSLSCNPGMMTCDTA